MTKYREILRWKGLGFSERNIALFVPCSRNTVEQQSYRACMGLLKLADKYSPAKLEEACKAALSYTPSPS